MVKYGVSYNLEQEGAESQPRHVATADRMCVEPLGVMGRIYSGEKDTDKDTKL